jgi:hypothetical protein
MINARVTNIQDAPRQDRILERINNADAGPCFARNKVRTGFWFGTSLMLSRFDGSLCTSVTSAGPAAVFGQPFGLMTAFPQLEKTSPAFVSGGCCTANPKVKWSALERSPNVSHPILSHGLLQSRQDISCDWL